MSINIKCISNAVCTLIGESPKDVPLPRTSKNYAVYLAKNAPTQEELEAERRSSTPDSPLVSAVLVGKSFESGDIHASVCSLMRQTYSSWELILLVGLGFADSKRYETLKNVKIVMSEQDGAGLLYSAEGLIRGDYVMLLKAGDILSPDAFHHMTLDGSAELIYADNDEIVDGERIHPFFKPAFSPITGICYNYIRRPLLVKTSLHSSIGGFGGDMKEYMVSLIKTAKHSRSVDRVLISMAPEDESYPEHSIKLGNGLEVVSGLFTGSFRIASSVIRKKSVSIIVACPNKRDRLMRCLESIDTLSTYFDYRLIIAADENVDKEMNAYLEALKRNKAAKVIKNKSGSIPALFNIGASRSLTDLLIFMSGDIEIISPDFIEALTDPLYFDGVSVCGGKLLSPDGNLWHTGQVIGIEGWVGSLYRGERDDMRDETKCFYTAMQRNVSAVSGLFMAVSAEDFLKIGMFDETFQNIGWDTEFCLRASWLGKRTVYTPFASAVLSEVPHDYRDASLKELERCYDAFRDTLIDGDPYFSLNYDYRYCVPTLSIKSFKPITLNPMF